MKAIALTHYLPSDHPTASSKPIWPTRHRARATCWCGSRPPPSTRSIPRCVLPRPRSKAARGYWAGTPWEVIAVGREVTLFKAGDRVWYAGDISRPGSNSALQLVDERIAALAPTSLSDLEAAALPLTAITAWETLFERMRLTREQRQAADHRRRRRGRLHRHPAGPPAHRHGGDRHRLAPRDPGLVPADGAHQVVSHHQLQEELTALGITQVDAIFCTNATEQHWDAMASLISPFGHICTIAESSVPWDLSCSRARASPSARNSCLPAPCSRPRHDRAAQPVGTGRRSGTRAWSRPPSARWWPS